MVQPRERVGALACPRTARGHGVQVAQVQAEPYYTVHTCCKSRKPLQCCGPWRAAEPPEQGLWSTAALAAGTCVHRYHVSPKGANMAQSQPEIAAHHSKAVPAASKMVPPLLGVMCSLGLGQMRLSRQFTVLGGDRPSWQLPRQRKGEQAQRLKSLTIRTHTPHTEI